MIHHTQTRVIPQTETTKAKGNCWQTCAAAILDLPIEALPDQVDVEEAGQSFNNALIAYLWKHHRMSLVMLHQWSLRAPIHIDDVYHIACGPSPRTATNGVNHCVVCRAGTIVWDVHPSRAGLLSVNEFQFIVPAATDAQPPKVSFGDRDCMCPACGGIVAAEPSKPAEIVAQEHAAARGAIVRIGAEDWVHRYIKEITVVSVPSDSGASEART